MVTVEGIGGRGGVDLPTNGSLAVVQKLRRVVLRRLNPVDPTLLSVRRHLLWVRWYLDMFNQLEFTLLVERVLRGFLTTVTPTTTAPLRLRRGPLYPVTWLPVELIKV